MSADVYTCAKCGETKPKTEFHKDRKSKQGVVSRCKTCIQQESKARYPERKAYFQEYSRQHREQINARQRIKNRTRREKRNQLKQAWRAQHPLDYRRTVVNANAVKYGAKDRISLAEIEALWTAQGGICPFTLMPLTPKTAVLHHIIHLANGGSNTIDNMIFTTRQAHNRKAKFTLEEFCDQAWLDMKAVLKRVEQIHSNYRTKPVVKDDI